MMNFGKRAFFAGAALFLVGAATAQAQITLVTSRAALAGTDFIDWGSLGVEFTSVASPFNTLSNLGVAVTGSEAVSPFQRLDQGSGFSGNFANGDELLYTGNLTVGGAGPVTLSFANNLSAFGLQIMANFFGPFDARLTFFDASAVQVGTVTLAGTSNSNGDNSAIFIGGVSGSLATNFASVVISLDSAVSDTTDFAVNQADFSSATAVPEPASLALMGVGIASGLGCLWRRRLAQRALPRRR